MSRISSFSRRFVSLALVCAVGAASLFSAGCARQIGAAIEHRNLDVQAKMSDTIFLDPVTLDRNRRVYVRVTNTSDFQEIDFQKALRDKLTAKGYELVRPSEAAYLIQANLLYIGEQKQGVTMDGMLAGGYGGAVLGALLGSDRSLRSAGLAGLAGAAVGSAAGAVAGAMFHVDTYIGALDIQLKELVGAGKVVGTQKATTTSGSATTMETERQVESDFQEYRSRIVVNATQTNIDRTKACAIIAERMADQVAGLF